MKLYSLQIAFSRFLNECIIYLSQFLWCTLNKKVEFLRYKRSTIKCHILLLFNVGILTLWINSWIDSSVKMWRGWKDVNGEKRQSYRRHFQLWLWTTNFAKLRKTFSLTLKALPRTNSLVTWEKWREGKISETIHLPVP